MNLSELIPYYYRVRVPNMRKLRGFNAKNNFGMGNLLLLNKDLNSLGVVTAQRAGSSSINDVQKILPDQDCFHEQQPLVIVGLI
jgi:hypothetical protein